MAVTIESFNCPYSQATGDLGICINEFRDGSVSLIIEPSKNIRIRIRISCGLQSIRIIIKGQCLNVSSDKTRCVRLQYSVCVINQSVLIDSKTSVTYNPFGCNYFISIGIKESYAVSL